MIGAELGYRYVGSPLIAAGAGRGPRARVHAICSDHVAGRAAAPSWLDDGSAIQDRIGYGHGYTLLRLGGTPADSRALEQAFAALGAPLAVLEHCR